jgi:hypothetical protein
MRNNFTLTLSSVIIGYDVSCTTSQGYSLKKEVPSCSGKQFQAERNEAVLLNDSFTALN